MCEGLSRANPVFSTVTVPVTKVVLLLTEIPVVLTGHWRSGPEGLAGPWIGVGGGGRES